MENKFCLDMKRIMAKGLRIEDNKVFIYFEEDVKEFIGKLEKYIEDDLVFYGEGKEYEDETKEDLIYFIDKLSGKL